MIFGIDSTSEMTENATDGDEIHSGVNEDGNKNTLALDVAPCQPQSGGNVLDKCNDQPGSRVSSDVSQNVQTGEGSNGDDISCPVGLFIEVAEDQSTV